MNQTTPRSPAKARGAARRSRLTALMIAAAAWFLGPARVEADLVTWFDDPWRVTNGGTVQPTDGDLARPWALRACRNDTEQGFIGLMTTGERPVEVTVALQSDLSKAGVQAELLIAGAIRSRKSPDGALVNLFTPEQLATFQGEFPKSFTNTDQIKDFPTLHLQPHQPAWIWLRVRTMSEDEGNVYPDPGTYPLRFTATGEGVHVEKAIELIVLPVTLPAAPVLESMPYGGVDEQDDLRHHTTVSGGHRRFVQENFVVQAGLYGKPVSDWARQSPVKFQKRINLAVDDFVETLRRQGVREDQLLVEIIDEPADNAGRDGSTWLSVAQAIKRYRPELKIIANPGPDWERSSVTLEGTFKPLDPYVDVWMPYVQHLGNDAIMKFLHQTGKPLWIYATPSLPQARHETGCLKYWRKAGWLAIKHDLDGIGFWSASATYGDRWDDFDKNKGAEENWQDPAIVFESPAGAIATRAWEAWRETLEDAALYRLLERAVKAGVVPEPDLPQARQWLKESPDRMLALPADQATADWHEIRNTALDLLAALQPQAEKEWVNIAPGAQITAPGETAHLTDGNVNTSWSPNTWRTTVTFEWDQPRVLEAVRLVKRPRSPYASPCQYRVDLKMPDGNWNNVYTTWGDNGPIDSYGPDNEGLPEVEILLWENQAATGLRLRNLAILYDSFISMQEVEIFAAKDRP